MKKSEAIEVILKAYNSALDYDEMTESQARIILNKLEKAGIISPRYFTRSVDGLYDVQYGWQPERAKKEKK